MTADLTTICAFWFMIIVLINVQKFASHIIYKRKTTDGQQFMKNIKLQFLKEEKSESKMYNEMFTDIVQMKLENL